LTTATLFGLCAAVLIGLGLYGLVVEPRPLRKLIAFNLVGNGVFQYFGVVALRGAVPGVGGDPVPQGLVITGLVVAFAGSALAIALLLRLFRDTGQLDLSAAVTARPPSGADAN